MSLTSAQKRAYEYFHSREYASASDIDSLRVGLERDGNSQTLSFALEPFLAATCPGCGAEGAFRFHFLGRLVHTDCGRTWYVPPGTYAVEQLRRSVRAGMNVGGEMSSEMDRKGESGSWVAGVFGFIMGVAFRLTFAIISVPFQAAVSLTQKPAADRKPAG